MASGRIGAESGPTVGSPAIDEDVATAVTSRALRRDGDAHYARRLRIHFAVLNFVNDAVFSLVGIGSFLTRALIRADAGFLIDFGAGIPHHELRSHTPLH